MGANPLVYIFLCTILAPASGDTGTGCRQNCCAADEFCCGSSCIPVGSREAFTCVSVPNGCCTALNRCARAANQESASAPTQPTNDIVSSDSTPSKPASNNAVTSDEDPDGPRAAAQPPTSGPPCNKDCCVSGTFCCGSTCRRQTLRGSLSCPLMPFCCSNPRNICSNGTPAPPPQVVPTPAPPPAASPPQAGVAPTPTAEISVSATPPAPGPAPTQTAVCDDGCEAWWAQCGGAGYRGPGCCTDGSTCEDSTATYQQCVPDDSSPLCSSGPPEPAGAYCQCGGASFLGLPECGPGLACVAINVFYSQCRPLCSVRTDSRRERRDRDITSSVW